MCVRVSLRDTDPCCHLRHVIVFVVILAGGLPCAWWLPADRAEDWWGRAAVYQTKYYALKSDLGPRRTPSRRRHMDATFEAYMLLFSKLPLQVRRPALALALFVCRSGGLSGGFGGSFWRRRQRFRGPMHQLRGQQIAITTYRDDKPIESMKSSLQHEGFHQVARHFVLRLPPWADEGLAVLFGRGVMVGNTLAVGEYTKRDKARLTAAIQANRLRPFDEFFALPSREWNEQVREGAQARTTWRHGAWFTIASSPENRKMNPALLFLVQPIAASTAGRVPERLRHARFPRHGAEVAGLRAKHRRRPTIARRCGDWSFWPRE